MRGEDTWQANVIPDAESKGQKKRLRGGVTKN